MQHMCSMSAAELQHQAKYMYLFNKLHSAAYMQHSFLNFAPQKTQIVKLFRGL